MSEDNGPFPFDPADIGQVQICSSIEDRRYSARDRCSPAVLRVADALRERVKAPFFNLSSLEPVLVGSLGDAWLHIAEWAIEAARTPSIRPTDEEKAAERKRGEGFVARVRATRRER